MSIYTIYRVSNTINQKFYIGFTGRNPNKRWQEHQTSSRNPKRNRSHLYRAMSKHGQDKFIFEVIYQSKDKEHTHKIMEEMFIHEHNSLVPHGYNLTVGGDGASGYKHSEESKAKMSISKRDIAKSESFKDNLRGRTLPPSHRSKIGDSNSFEWYIHFPDGHTELIRNLNDFCRLHGLHAGHMSNVAKGKSKSHKGFTCRLASLRRT